MATQELTLDSREVAKMIEKRHDHLIRDIAKYVLVIDMANQNDFSQPNFGAAEEDDFSGLNFELAEDEEGGTIQAGKSLEYFIPSFYVDAQGKTRPCYLCTKKGCDLIANKLTGDKGIRFTVEYIERFEEMTKQLQQFNPYAATRQTIGDVARFLHEVRLIAKEGGISLAKSMQSATEYLQAKGEPLSDCLAKMLLEKENAQQERQLTLFDAVDAGTV